MNSTVITDDCTDLAALEGGNLEAFGRIHARHAGWVLSLCRRHGSGGPFGSLADAEDATQEVFIRAYERLDRVDDCTGFGRWLSRIATNVVRERRRSTARRFKHEGNVMTTAPLSSPPAAEASAMRREQIHGLERALDELADDERLAIHIHYLEHDPVATAARVLSLSRSAYYKLLARARGSLATLLEPTPKESHSNDQ